MENTVKIIGRISQAGKEYLQTSIHVEGEAQDRFIPVYYKKGLEKLNYISLEKKVDKRGVVYTLYTVDENNVFFPEDLNEETGEKTCNRAILTK